MASEATFVLGGGVLLTSRQPKKEGRRATDQWIRLSAVARVWSLVGSGIGRHLWQHVRAC